MPKVVVGLPVHNGENYVAHAIDSILAQTLKDFTLVISDNASTDATGKICSRYAAEDDRVTYVRQAKNLGAAPNYNAVLASAPPSEYFVWIAHDDVAAPNFLEDCVAALDETPDATVAFPRMVDIDANGETIGRAPARPDLTDPDPAARFAGVINQRHRNDPIFGVIRRTILATTDLHGSYSGSDRTLLAELALRGPFVELDDPLFSIRQHAGRSVRLGHGRWDMHVREAWFDTSRANKIVFPKWRRAGAYMAAVRTAPGLSIVERGRTYWTMVRWLGDRNWKALTLDVILATGTIYRRVIRRFQSEA
ncbi:MAG: glycosyltransferase [Acidimicrobiia bacterium]|nr:glycosyltransferase [Acidimicrobiia bacterium]